MKKRLLIGSVIIFNLLSSMHAMERVPKNTTEICGIEYAMTYTLDSAAGEWNMNTLLYSYFFKLCNNMPLDQFIERLARSVSFLQEHHGEAGSFFIQVPSDNGEAFVAVRGIGFVIHKTSDCDVQLIFKDNALLPPFLPSLCKTAVIVSESRSSGHFARVLKVPGEFHCCTFPAMALIGNVPDVSLVSQVCFDICKLKVDPCDAQLVAIVSKLENQNQNEYPTKNITYYYSVDEKYVIDLSGDTVSGTSFQNLRDGSWIPSFPLNMSPVIYQVSGYLSGARKELQIDYKPDWTPFVAASVKLFAIK